MDYLDFITRVTTYIPDKGQVKIRYYGLYADAHRGRARQAIHSSVPLRIVEEELRRIPTPAGAVRPVVRSPQLSAAGTTSVDVARRPVYIRWRGNFKSIPDGL